MPVFSRDRLRILAGDAAFARGEAYHAEGAVTLVSTGAEEVTALVQGGEVYQVVLRGGGQRISGSCTCPAFERDAWCKHLVATALAASEAALELPEGEAETRTHLVGLGAEALADMLLGLAERDPALRRRLDLAASAARAPANQHAARLRSALESALPHPDDYEGGGGWAEEVLDLLAQVPALIAGGAAAEAKDLLGTLLDEAPGAVEMMEEADEGLAVLERAAALHLEACRALGPDPAELAAELFDLAEEDIFGTFDRAEETYAELLGPPGLAAYRRLAEAAHARLPPVGRGGMDPRAAERRWLTDMLDRFAAREGDLDRRIALRRAALADAADHLALARFCLEHGRADLALRCAEDGAWLFEDASATPLVEFLAGRLVAEGRREGAVAALWQGFERAPAMGLFRALAGLGVADAADRAVALLRSRRAALRGGDRWRLGALLDLEVEILMAAGRLPEAWAAARGAEPSEALLLRLARASEADLPGEAARAYRAAIERQIGLTNRHGYEEACRLLGRLALVEPQSEHAAYVAELRTRYRAKRSLLPMLDRHLAGRAGG